MTILQLDNYFILLCRNYWVNIVWSQLVVSLTCCRLQLIGTLSGGQKSRVAFAALSLQHPHILLLDEVREASLPQVRILYSDLLSLPIT